VREFARDDHNHNASNHGINSGPRTGPRVAHDDYDAHGRRLLIAKPVAVASEIATALWAVLVFQSSTEFDRPQMGYDREAVRIFEQALLRFGLPLPQPD
jgi:hypothetical protein